MKGVVFVLLFSFVIGTTSKLLYPWINNKRCLEEITQDLSNTISSPPSPYSVSQITSQINSLDHYGLISNISQLNMINKYCPKWIIRNATADPWYVFTNDIGINKQCLNLLSKSVDSITRIDGLDLTDIEFDHESLSFLHDLVKQKKFSYLTIDLKNLNQDLVNQLFSIMGEAKEIESIDIGLGSPHLSFNESIKSFAKSSKTKHIISDSYLILKSLIFHASSLNHLESITFDASGPLNFQFTTDDIEMFPKLNAIYSNVLFEHVMKSRNSINGASIHLNNEDTNFNQFQKKLKSLNVFFGNENKCDHINDLLINSKDTLKSITLFLSSTCFSINNNHFFINNRVLDHLRLVIIDNPEPFIDYNGTNLNLTSFDYFHVNSLEPCFQYSNVLDFISSQKHLKELKIWFNDIQSKSISLNMIILFYKRICQIIRLNVGIKTVSILLPHFVDVLFIKQFVELTKRIGRLDFILNSVQANLIIDIDPNDIPLDLRI